MFLGTPQIIRPSASVSVGVVGPKGASLLGAPRAPLATDGFDGDYWIVSTAGAVQLWGPKTSGVWPTAYLSLMGPQGAPGPQILSGQGAPTQPIGNSGDFYLDLVASALYGPKNSGQWPTPGTSLVGQTGPIGPANTLQVGTVTQLAVGAAPTVTITGQAPNQTVNFGIPQGQPGKNGTGTGTVVGPASSVAGRVATYADASGTNLLDSGIPAGAATLPVKTVTGASYAFGAADLFCERRRTNGGAAMADTFPPANTVGLVDGTTLQINNSDLTASLTLSPGAGTVILTATGSPASVTLEAMRSTRWTYDLANTAWRPTMNSLTACILTRGQIVAAALGSPF